MNNYLTNFHESEINVPADFDLENATILIGLRYFMRIITMAEDPDGYGPKISKRNLAQFIKKHPKYNIEDVKREFSPEEMAKFQLIGQQKLLTLGTKDEQLIDPTEWTDIQKFCGMTSDLILNPHVWLAFLRSINSYTPSSDILVLMQCGVGKPYTANMNKTWALSGCFLEKPLYDFAYLSIVPIMAFPVDASISYPFFFYEAGHFVSKDMEEFEEETSKIPLLVDLILKKGYKKIIFCHNGRWRTLFEKVEKIFKETDIKLIDLVPQEFFDEVKDRYFKGKIGLTRTRILLTRETKRRFASLFPDTDPEVFLNNPQILKDKNRKRRKINEKYGILTEEGSRAMNNDFDDF